MIVEFHSFNLADVDDVDIYVADPIWQWQQTELGQWAMTHARDLTYHTSVSPDILGYRISIRGRIEESPALTEYLLKYGK